RSLSHSPIFQNAFSFQNAPVDSTNYPSTEVSAFPLGYEMAKFDLTLIMWEYDSGIGGSFEYNTDLFDRSTIDRMANHFSRLLEGIASDPGQTIGSYEMLSEPERHQLLVEWNNTGFDYPADGILHGLFEQRAALQPDAIAIYHDGNTLSYAELNSRANRLAHKLIGLGVTNETLVAVCCDRSAEMLTGMMAILKAGGAYVPIDPDYPPDRISYMLSDSEAPVVLTNHTARSSLTETHAQTLCLDNFDFSDSSLSDANPELPVAAAQLGYTIYTSGSTGLPKGVQIEHGAVVNFLRSMADNPGLDSNDTLLSVTTPCFDISILEFFLPLTVGAKLVIASQNETTDGFALQELIKKHSVSVMQATPATWRMMLQAGWQGNPKLKVLCGGEALDRSLADQLAAGNAELWNMYGPTETTIWSTCHRYAASDELITVGKPIANTLIYVLDEHLQAVPAGVPGELYIGGDGVARGYWQRDELNRAQFQKNPFADGRIYKTGDRVRWLNNGNLEVLGRTDFQVKLRGFRIELGEIESALSNHQDVTQAVVTLREDTPGDQRLVAYLIAPEGVTLESATLREHISSDLPDYMLPTAYVQLERFPLTPNGKIDRNALPAPDQDQLAKVEYVPPRNPLEESLCALWTEVLGVDNVGIHDDFFALGGHSLIATQLVSRIRDSLNAELALRQL
ncbi:MAG: amino acid adenylation domain-containing protein, partial [Gammaproteobacteria bacterium]|nr:amino acid adenylation domain-containing protein [Gammaproteobacteria bacterium]